MAVLSRADKSPLSRWWWTVDRSIIVSALSLMALGIVLAMAASPPVANRLGLPDFFFVQRQAIFLPAVALLLIATSFLNPRYVRRGALALFVFSFVMMIVVLGFAPEFKGARRWIDVFGVSIQPSEFIKPAYIILAAWLMSEAQVKKVPGRMLALAIFALIAGLLFLQPDVGQLALLGAATVALLFLSGIPWLLVICVAGLGAGGLLGAYMALPHVKSRIDRFLDPASGDTYQVDLALRSVIEGGWFGRGPGEGSVKHILPDPHTDFIFAVAAEEFGILFCLVLVGLFGYIMLRVLVHALESEDPFIRLSLAGLALIFGGQAAINMAVNLNLLPAKGMTLPFISFGRSSLISSAITVGFMLALGRYRTRRVHVADTAPILEPAR